MQIKTVFNSFLSSVGIKIKDILFVTCSQFKALLAIVYMIVNIPGKCLFNPAHVTAQHSTFWSQIVIN